VRRSQDIPRSMDQTRRTVAVKQPTLRQARAKRSLRCGALRNVVRDLDRMSMTTRLPMLPAFTTTFKPGKAEVAVAVTCLQMNTQNSRRGNSDDKEN
jgi:hypothetical protein